MGYLQSFCTPLLPLLYWCLIVVDGRCVSYLKSFGGLPLFHGASLLRCVGQWDITATRIGARCFKLGALS